MYKWYSKNKSKASSNNKEITVPNFTVRYAKSAVKNKSSYDLTINENKTS